MVKQTLQQLGPAIPPALATLGPAALLAAPSVIGMGAAIAIPPTQIPDEGCSGDCTMFYVPPPPVQQTGLQTQTQTQNGQTQETEHTPEPAPASGGAMKGGGKAYEPTKDNLDKMSKGQAPTGTDGHPVELHHDGQTQTSNLQEMTRTDHRLNGNFKKNHTNTGQQASQINRSQFNKQRQQHWKQQHQQQNQQ
jgi:hypothetical protein